MKSTRNILVTAALPYANGPLHLGHLVEYIQADIWVRFQRLSGHRCLFIGGDDAHGTPIMISAEKRGVSPEELIREIHEEHTRDLNGFLISFDNFYTTHSLENRELSESIYRRLREKGDIQTRVIQQAYDPVRNMFLPDRYIKGTCPRCGSLDQYGDVCEQCGSTYAPNELIHPVSILSGATPIEKESEHYFFELNHYTEWLKTWLTPEHLQPQIIHKLNEWFSEGLKPWDISRDAPYFGFKIPNTDHKYFYVWLDAPIGYMASLKNLAERRSDIHFEDYWRPDSPAELRHFIGKDVVYFHTLFWPAILHAAGYRLPSSVHVHGFLTVNGQKMSKSRGTFITAHHYLKELNPEYLRYYFASKLSPNVEDIDLRAEDFQHRVNSDLVGKYVNLASRCAGFIHKKFEGRLSDALHNSTLFAEFVEAGETIADHYEHLNYNKAIRAIMTLADRANQYIDQEKPWVLAKQTEKSQELQSICTQGLNLFKCLTLYLKPILPKTAENSEYFLNIEPLNWKDLHNPLLAHTIRPFKPLMTRIPEEVLHHLVP